MFPGLVSFNHEDVIPPYGSLVSVDVSHDWARSLHMMGLTLTWKI